MKPFWLKESKMKTIKEINALNEPIIVIDSTLEKHKKQSLFKEKLQEANKTLLRVGLPKKK